MCFVLDCFVVPKELYVEPALQQPLLWAVQQPDQDLAHACWTEASSFHHLAALALVESVQRASPANALHEIGIARIGPKLCLIEETLQHMFVEILLFTGCLSDKVLTKQRLAGYAFRLLLRPVPPRPHPENLHNTFGPRFHIWMEHPDQGNSSLDLSIESPNWTSQIIQNRELPVPYSAYFIRHFFYSSVQVYIFKNQKPANLKAWKRRALNNDRILSGRLCFHFCGVFNLVD